MENNIDEDIKMAKNLIKILDKTCENNNSESARVIERLLSELETYKKIAEKLTDIVALNTVPKEECKQCIIDWARKEVEKDEKNIKIYSL